MQTLAEMEILADVVAPVEQAQMESYRRVGGFLNLLHAKARLSLDNSNKSDG